MDSGDVLTNEQTEKVLQFQDLTGIDDINVCKDILTRHQWDLEVAIQEQLNIREGRPTMYATSTDVRAPQVLNDRFLQQIFSANMPGGRNNGNAPIVPVPAGFSGILGYLFRFVFQLCYTTISSLVATVLNLVKSDERIVTDPLGDVTNFIRAYNEKYPTHPVFYQGTYAQALNDAKRELKFLLVYLHSESSNVADVQSFCNRTLSDQGVIDYINRNMLFWGCDIASPEGYRVSHSIISRCYPLMVLIGLRSNRMLVMGRFEGDCTPEELVRRLRIVVNENEVWLSQARVERLERSFNQSLRDQQDEAYEQSLRADEEKERRKQQERDEILKLQEAEEEERRAEIERKNAIARLKIELAERVPSEPPVDSPNSVSVVFKLPNGARIERRFLSSDSLNDVYTYIFCHPNSPDEFEITTNFPKRVLCAKDSISSHIEAKTIAEVGLKNREVLFVNDLDA